MNNLSYQASNAVVVFNDEHVPKTKEELRKNLKHVYDVINKISRELEEKGIYPEKWFLTSKQLDDMKKSGKYNFI